MAFKIRAVWADARALDLWSRVLQPAEATRDRGTQVVEVTIPTPAPKALLFETHPLNSRRQEWTYWTGIEWE